jgi:NUMOD4 motif.
METWTPIKGYEGLYCVSDLGRIWSVNIGVMSFSKNSNWYKRFNLCKDGNKKTASVHIIVADNFIPNPENKPHVNHKNGIKTDCRAVNLEWATISENSTHSVKVLGRKGALNIHRRKAIVSTNGMGERKIYNGIRQASRELNIHYQSIQRCIKNPTYTCRGLKFSINKKDSKRKV